MIGDRRAAQRSTQFNRPTVDTTDVGVTRAQAETSARDGQLAQCSPQLGCDPAAAIRSAAIKEAFRSSPTAQKCRVSRGLLGRYMPQPAFRNQGQAILTPPRRSIPEHQDDSILKAGTSDHRLAHTVNTTAQDLDNMMPPMPLVANARQGKRAPRRSARRWPATRQVRRKVRSQDRALRGKHRLIPPARSTISRAASRPSSPRSAASSSRCAASSTTPRAACARRRSRRRAISTVCGRKCSAEWRPCPSTRRRRRPRSAKRSPNSCARSSDHAVLTRAPAPPVRRQILIACAAPRPGRLTREVPFHFEAGPAVRRKARRHARGGGLAHNGRRLVPPRPQRSRVLLAMGTRRAVPNQRRARICRHRPARVGRARAEAYSSVSTRSPAPSTRTRGSGSAQSPERGVLGRHSQCGGPGHSTNSPSVTARNEFADVDRYIADSSSVGEAEASDPEGRMCELLTRSRPVYLLAMRADG